ncbi:MAG: ABC transporter permease [Oscillospiraceae bacterium]|nr:ABC transporter permease [Oscillospiraceae bacterium]
MVAFIVRRLVSSLFIVLLVSMVVFILIRMTPGCPVSALVDQEINSRMQAGEVLDPVMQQELMDRIFAEHGLDLPIPIQFVNWLGRMLRGDFGRSMVRNYDIRTEVGRRMAVTVYLGVLSLIVTVVLGIFLGVVAAVRNGKLIDSVVTSFGNFGMTVPAFLIAILLVWVFGFLLEWLPIWGFHLPWRGDVGQSIRRTILPVVTLSIGGIGGLSRMTRSAMLDVLNADHVRTAWAKGMREKTVIFRHVMKNGLMPIVSGFGGMIRGIFGGSVVVETIFVVPGMGALLVQAMQSNDYNVVQATTVLLTFITVMSNLVVDLMYVWVDPRIQLA